MAELVACPECKKHLQVPDELIGKHVQCPECKHTFTASIEEDKASTATKESKPGDSKKLVREESRSSSSGSGKKKKSRADDDDDDVVDDDDDDDDDRPRRRSRRRSIDRGNFMPHRGGMILAFGIIGLVGGLTFCFPYLFGPIAWIMGNADMKEIREGRMDPEGEGMTQVGRILGIIATVLLILSVLFLCGYFVFIFFIIGLVGLGAANQKNMNFPPPPNKF